MVPFCLRGSYNQAKRQMVSHQDPGSFLFAIDCFFKDRNYDGKTVPIKIFEFLLLFDYIIPLCVLFRYCPRCSQDRKRK